MLAGYRSYPAGCLQDEERESNRNIQRRGQIETMELHPSSSAAISSSQASSSSSSSSSSSNSSSAHIIWIDRSHDSKFDSDMWQLDLFLCSETKINGAYKVKCVLCEKRHVIPPAIWDYDGTKTFLYHAAKVHPKEEKVAAYMFKKSQQDAKKKAAKIEEEKKLQHV